MAERLDRLEAVVERTASNVDDLLGAIAQTDRQVQDLRGESADAQQRFKVLRAEAQNDREESRRNADMLTANIQRLEQSISKLSDNVALMVAESAAQRETTNNLIKLATALVNQRAS